MPMERRAHHRVRLRLPARIRWATPFGQSLEVQETLDVSRGGLLFTSKTPAEPGAILWITFPYDSSVPAGQPEVPARVVHAETPQSGAQRLGVRFELLALHERNGHKNSDLAQERRVHPRRALAVPVRVRPECLPWYEEAMTLDVSSGGLRFLSTREYEPGARLMLSFDRSTASPWPGEGEFRTLVVRIESEPDGRALAVSVCRLRA